MGVKVNYTLSSLESVSQVFLDPIGSIFFNNLTIITDNLLNSTDHLEPSKLISFIIFFQKNYLC